MDEDDDVPEPAGEEEEQPQLMPMPLPGVRSFIHFPDGAHTITGGKVSEIIVGVQNDGEVDIEMVSCNGKMTYPQQANEIIQNFTNVGYDKQVIAYKAEASFFYAFMPNTYTGGREFNIAIEIYYKQVNTNHFYRALPFNETVSILESTEGIAPKYFSCGVPFWLLPSLPLGSFTKKSWLKLWVLVKVLLVRRKSNRVLRTKVSKRNGLIASI